MTIKCPNCNSSLTIKGNGSEKVYCRACGCEMNLINGWMYAFNNDVSVTSQNIEKHRKKRIKYFILGFVTTVVILFVCFWNIFLNEYMDYKGLDNSTNIYDYERFLDKYPNSKYYQSVYNKYDDLYFKKVKEETFDTVKKICYECNLLEQYKNNFNNKKGKHLSEIEIMLENCYFENLKRSKKISDLFKFYKNYPRSKHLPALDSLTQKAFISLKTKYDSASLVNKISPRARCFLKEMLDFFAETKSTTIYIKFVKETVLKNWEDYSIAGRKYCDNILADDGFGINMNKLKYRGIEKPSIVKPYPLKEYFTEGNINQLEQIILNKLDSVFISFFNENLCAIERTNNDSIQPKCVAIKIKYKIKNQENTTWDVDWTNNKVLSILYPHLWIRTENNSGYDAFKQFKGYLLGIEINWEFNMVIPKKTTQPYFFSNITRPTSEEISLSVDNPNTSAYEKMIKEAFEDFALKIGKNLGLKN